MEDMIKIEGYENYYITKNGEVWNGKKFISRWEDNVGYYQVVLYKNGKKKHIRVHRLVAQYFVSNPHNKKQVNHIDGNKLNNNFENLEWVSNSENTKHGYDNGLYRSRKRSHSILVKTKDGQAVGIFPSIRNLSEVLGLNRKTVTSILKNEKTNNYKYLFEYVQEGLSTNEKVFMEKDHEK